MVRDPPMKRLITIEIDLTDEQLGKIIPSSTVWVEIYHEHYGSTLGEAEIISVKDETTV